MSVNKNFTHQAIALAGIAQATALVDQLATTGEVDTPALTTSIGSLLKLESTSVLDIFGELSGLEVGLKQLQQQITGYSIGNRQQARYSTSLVFLEGQLAKHPKVLQTISQGIERVQLQAESLELIHENILANLSDIYSQTLSHIQPRIQIKGQENFLQHRAIVNKIRALLLAGIRSAVLWRQCGGARWKFLFYRTKLQDEVRFLLTKI
jgi:high frequency lysogenization protein